MRRFRIAQLLAAAALLFSAGTVAVAAPSSSCTTAAGTVIGGSPGGEFLGLSNSDLSRELDLAAQAGMTAIRLDVDWSVIEPTRGNRNWAAPDRVINAVTARGMCVLGVAAYTPRWAARPTDFASNSHYRPAKAAEYAAFVRAAAERYRGKVRAWEIWNEPNNAGFFLPAADATAYGELLKAAYPAVKAADPSAIVVAGGLSPASDNGRDIAPLTFYRQLYQRGYNRYFDAGAIHPYSYPALPNDLSTAAWNTALAVAPMYDIMVAAGDGNKQLWLTEAGAPTGTAQSAVTQAVQAKTLEIILQTAKTTSWIGPTFVYSIRDAGTNLADPEQNFGIYQRNGTPKAARSVLQRFAGP